MAFPNFATLLDDFNRADEGPPPGDSWASEMIGLGGGMAIVSNQIKATAAAYGNDAYWKPSKFGPDCEATIDVPTLEIGHSVFLGLRIASPGASANGYWLSYDDGVPYWAIYRIDSGTSTRLGATASGSLAAGDSLGFEIVGDTLKGYKKSSGTWTEMISRTDSIYLGAGYGGCGQSGVVTRLDNFNAGPASLDVPTKDVVLTRSASGAGYA